MSIKQGNMWPETGCHSIEHKNMRIAETIKLSTEKIISAPV